MPLSPGGGLEGSDLRRGLPAPSEAKSDLVKRSLLPLNNNDGSGGHQAHLVESKQDGEIYSPHAACRRAATSLCAQTISTLV
jgi:hypothetical protein